MMRTIIPADVEGNCLAWGTRVNDVAGTIAIDLQASGHR